MPLPAIIDANTQRERFLKHGALGLSVEIRNLRSSCSQEAQAPRFRFVSALGTAGSIAGDREVRRRPHRRPRDRRFRRITRYIHQPKRR